MNLLTNKTTKAGSAASLLRVGALLVAAALSACGGGDGESVPFAAAVAPPDSGSTGPSANITCKDLDGSAVTVKPKTITVYNNSDRIIYPVLSTSENETNLWVQGCLRVDDKPYPTKSVYKLYVNEGTGIPVNSSVTVTLPLYSELSTDSYITWWNGGRVVLADSNERLRDEEDQKMDTPGAVTCQGRNTSCQLSVYASKVQFPENIHAQLSEYTFGDAVIPPGQKPLLKPENVGYNISYVDHVYLPVGIGPRNNPYIGYSGSVQALTTFTDKLKNFIGSDAGAGWPVYNLSSLKLPGAYNVFAQREGVLPAIDDVPVKPAGNLTPPVLTVQKCIEGQCSDDEKKNLHFGEAVQRMQNLWGSCVGWGSEDISPYVTETITCPADMAAKLDAVKQFFAQNHQDYLALYAAGKCKGDQPEKPVFTYMEALKHIYGWVPFNEGCGAGDNKLDGTTIPGWTHATIQPMYIHDLQYGYQQAAVKNNPKLNFNPYVALIHDDLQMNAYGFSVDDAVGFMSELGDGLVFVVGGPNGLENPRQFSYADGFELAIGTPPVDESTPLIKKYGVCALNQDANDPNCDVDKQDLIMPTNRRIAGFRVGSVPSYPIKVRFTDLKDNRYTLQVTERFAACALGADPKDCPANRTAIKGGLTCSVIRSDGTVHPKSTDWCLNANPNQSKDGQVTKNFLSFPVPVDYMQ